ncbi:MAG: tetratricopeptide repeat protein [Pirellulales bacterium]|nr:tetratricopeptide repeat protein [Pirellulales bacterium]
MKHPQRQPDIRLSPYRRAAGVRAPHRLIPLLIATAFWLPPEALAQLGLPVPSKKPTADAPALGLADYLAGLDALERSQATDALVALTRAVQVDSENADYYLARGVANILGEKLPPAIKDLERALRLRPNHQKSKLWLAVAVGMTGDFARDSTIYPFATHDLDESFVRQASHDYGEVAFRSARDEVTQDLLDKREVAKKRISQAVALFAGQAQAQPGMEAALVARAQSLVDNHDYAGARTQLDRVLLASPEDFDAMFLRARCAVALGDYSAARADCTRVLTAHTDWAGAYLVRSRAAAGLGDVRRAKADLATAARLDAKLTASQQAEIEREIATHADPSAAPNFAALDQLAHADLSHAERNAAALRLVERFNNHRRRYDENYQDGLRQREEAVRSEPRSAARLVALGQFLLDEASVRRERVEPRGQFRKFRYQTPDMESREVARAAELADRALSLDPNQVDGLCLKAAALIWNQEYGDAETLLRRALAVAPRAPRALELFARVLEVASLEKSAEAAALRRPTYLGSHDEHVGDYIYTYTRWRYPSQAELQAADSLDAQAQQLVEMALEQIAAAAKASAGKPEGFQLQGLYDWRKGELDEAASQFAEAVRLAPNQVQWRYNLAALYDALGRSAESFQERLMAVNLIETTAGPLLAGTWDLINQTKFRTAHEALVRSGDIDVADSRVPAYLGVVAAAEENPDEAIAWFRVALAIERAKQQLAGKSLDAQASGPLAPDDYALYLGIARRLAETYLAQEKPEPARDVMLACLPLAKRVSRRDLTVDVPGALLPDPTLDPNTVPEAENVLSLFAWLHVAAGRALVDLKQNDAAIELLARVHAFEPLMQNGVGVTRLRAPTLYASLYLARAYIAKGDFESAQRYAMLLPRKRHGVGPSLGQFPELEEAGSRLQELIAQRRQGFRAEGSEESDEVGMPDEERVNQALRQIGPKIGHPELGDGRRRFNGDAGEAQLCAAVTQAVMLIVSPKSTLWRQDVVTGISLLGSVRQEVERRASFARSRPQPSRPDRRNPRGAPDPRLGNPEVTLSRIDTALGLLRALAVSRGYPAADLERDLSGASDRGRRARPGDR